MMAVETLPESSSDVSPAPKRWTVGEFYRLSEVGLIAPKARIELVEGELLEMSPIGNPHFWAVIRLTMLLARQVEDAVSVSVQLPLILEDETLVLPDIALLREPTGEDRSPSPVAALALLVIEVSDTSLSFDLNRKLPLYARSGIPEVWVVDVRQKRVHVFSQPSGDSYTLTRLFQSDAVVESATRPNLRITVAEVLR